MNSLYYIVSRVGTKNSKMANSLYNNHVVKINETKDEKKNL